MSSSRRRAVGRPGVPAGMVPWWWDTIVAELEVDEGWEVR